MKIKRILKKISLIIIMIVIFLCNFSMCYAANGLPDLSNYGTPTMLNETIIDVTNKILGVLIGLGAILITIFIAITGFGTILGSAEEKAVVKEKFGGYLIAALILTGGATIAKIIISIAESF